MKLLLLVLTFALSTAGYSMGGCKQPEPTPTGGMCTGVFKQDEGDFTVYIGNDGKQHKCSKPGGHCKAVVYNGCSASAEMCCHKQ